MAENINEALGVSNNAAAESPKEGAKPVDNSAENTLSTIATIVLILGIISTIVCVFTLTFVEVPKAYGYGKETEFSPAGFGTTVMVLFSTLISWSVMKVLSNISLTLKDLNGKIKCEQSAEPVTQPKTTSTNSYKKLSDDERIANLKTLVETGALSQEEFDEEVKRIKGTN